MILTNCASGTIATYVPSAEKPWNQERVLHLYRRMGFGATPAQLEAGLNMSPENLVDAIIDEAIALPLTPEPEWSEWNINDYSDFNTERGEQLIEWIFIWGKEMLANGFREKMALFWHNHFVTIFQSYACPSWMYQYHRLLQQFCLGNFKEFTVEMGKTPAMLVFLNGVQNTNLEPNENYARELFELFTLGQDNGYTQQDIVEAARALTGWNGFVSLCAPIGFVDVFHDSGEKTIFGQTGNWGYTELHDILFTERATLIADHICRKLYTHFVHPEVDEAIVSELAATFLDNNFELIPVIRQLFKSEHFFDDAMIGAIMKSPTELLMSFVRELSFGYNDEIAEALIYFIYILGQQFFSPPDVAGWPGNRSWMDTNSLTGRWQVTQAYVGYSIENTPEALREFAKKVSDNSNDPAWVTQSIIDYIIPNGLSTPEAYDRATTAFKWEVPENYFENGDWNLDWETTPPQVAFLLLHISRLPEFQLS